MNVAHVAMLLVIASAASAGRDASLSTVLTPDGRIMEGASGSFDPEGFRMTYGPDEEPLFVAEASLSGEPAPFSGGQYDTGTWYPLGSGVSGSVEALAVSGSDVYVGGCFTEAGGSPANKIARWDGGSWHSLGSGVEEEYSWDWVGAIAVSGPDIYVGGRFTQAGGSPANRIARWDGGSWHPLGSGVNHWVTALAVSGPDVYVGGRFTEAGGSPANKIARWSPNIGTEPSPEEIPVSPHAFPNPTSTGTELSFQSSGLSPLTLEIYDTVGRLVRRERRLWEPCPRAHRPTTGTARAGMGRPLPRGVLRETLQR